MQTRSSRYVEDDVSTKPKVSRASRNKYLYDEVNNGIRYEEIDTFSSVGFGDDKVVGKRSDYPKMSETNYAEQQEDAKQEEKVYDINSVLEEARKSRNIPAEVENKRNLQKAEYNILADLNKKYVSKKEKIEDELEKEGIRELIDTITSRNLPKELAALTEQEDDGKDLMSDLMATNANVLDNVNLEEEIAKEILVQKEENQNQDTSDEIKTEDGRLVNSFYTRSMDLTEHDFDIGDEIAQENKEKTKILILVVLIIIVVIAIIALITLKRMNII